MAEESDEKVELKISELLHLFQRFGRSVLGLLLLEIGWTVLLVMASKLVPEGGSGRDEEFSLLVGWEIGAVLIAAGWSIYSRLYAYLTTPALIAFRPIWDFAFIFAMIVAGAFDHLRNRRIAAKRTEEIEEWLSNNKEEAIAKAQKGPEPARPREELEGNYERWLAGYKEKFGDDALRKVAAKEVKLQPDRYIGWIGNMGLKLLSPLHSGLRIGIAPFNNFSHGDSLVSLKSPMEEFGSSIADLLSKLAHISDMRHLHFFTLPSHFAVRTHGHAKFALKLFKLDVLVWGHFTEDRRNVHAHLLTLSDLRLGDADSSRTEPRRLDLFPYAPIPEIRVARFLVTSEIGRHVVLVMAILRALSSQNEVGYWSRYWSKGKEDQRKKVGAWRQLWDNMQEAVTAIILFKTFSEQSSITSGARCCSLLDR
jgi:hypothetical protein